MAKCKFKIGPGAWKWEVWECPLEALPGEEYCYWHKEEEGKEPDDAKLRELKKNKILGVFLRKANLGGKELQEAFLWEANLQEAFLANAKLQGADFRFADLQGVDLSFADLQGAVLGGADLQGADLSFAKLQGADLRSANLEGANLIGVIADSGTHLDWANLTCANLYRSYLDETKTLRNAKFESEKEINEIAADFLKKGNKELAILDVWKIRRGRGNSEVVARLLEEELVRYVFVGVGIVFFDRKRQRVVRIPGNAKSKIFQKLRKRRNSEEEWNYVEISELNDLIERGT